MDYLIYKFFWWLMLAFGVGMFVGWFTCSRNDDHQQGR